MPVRISTIIGAATVLYVAILLNANFNENDMAEAQHIKQYEFSGSGVAAIPFGKLEGSNVSFFISINELSREENGTMILTIQNGSVTIDHGQTMTVYRFIAGTWQGKISDDGRSWAISGIVKDPLGKVHALEFNGDKVQSTNKGELYAVSGIMTNSESEYSLHHYGTIDTKR